MRVVLLNGPPRSGKDTAGAALGALLEGGYTPNRMSKAKFSDPLKIGVHATFGLLDEQGHPLPADWFESRKDQPCDEFFGETPRNAYIYHSENYLKPKYGRNVFGRILARRIKQLEDSSDRIFVGRTVVYIPDSGFYEEAEPVVNLVGPQNVMLVRIHRTGCDFSNDSRNYLYDVCDHEIDVVNEDIDIYRFNVAGHVASWLNRDQDYVPYPSPIEVAVMPFSKDDPNRPGARLTP